MSDTLIAAISATIGAAIGAASGVLAALVASHGSARKNKVEALAQEVETLATQLRSVRADLERALALLRKHGIDFHSGEELPSCRPEKRLSI